ncbi:hypothetical protein CSAL01_08353 [Colletotrichum salicis]|uniref:Uncharacterized protein n=1 Tax=Colletotrichum salicis TaxID=1209931 RepID=A0A135UMJ0_9PEZI|nr:hypothetical protein CSAL01_08353 [Colletotrichum salicis]
MQRNEDRQNTALEIGYSAGSLPVLVTGLQSQSSFECAAAVAVPCVPIPSHLSISERAQQQISRRTSSTDAAHATVSTAVAMCVLALWCTAAHRVQTIPASLAEPRSWSWPAARRQRGTAAGPPAPAFCEGKQRTDQRGSERDEDKEDEHGPGPLMAGWLG